MGQGFGPSAPPHPPNPNAHAAKLRVEYEQAQAEADEAADSAPDIEGRLDGFTVEFESIPAFELDL